MYEELDKYLLGYLPMDYWYDEGFSIARDILSKFSENDWNKLENDVMNKSLEYQKKLAYCIENSVDTQGLKILLLLVNVDGEELLEICVDSLRDFSESAQRTLILENEELFDRINIAMESAGIVTRKTYVDFLNKLGKQS